MGKSKKEAQECDKKRTVSVGKKRMLLWMTGILAALVLISAVIYICSKDQDATEQTEGNEKEQTTEILPESIMTVYGEMTEENLLENLKSSIVKIEAEVTDASNQTLTISGSGVILEITDSYVDIVTARHVVEQTATPQITFYEGSCVTGSVLAYGRQNDVAFVRVDRTVFLPDDEIKVNPAVCGDNADYNLLEPQKDVYLIGSSTVVAGDFVTARVKEKDKFIELFQNEMLLCDTTVYNGMSGGGVFLTDGKLMGVIVGTGDVDTVSVAITDVLAEYRSISK